MKSATRQLAAIMFTDMVGYTALMQEDEDRASSSRRRHRQVFEETVDKFSGKILQYYGDGTLCIFSSGLFAVQCAMEIQEQLRRPPEIPVRIGIHSGDVVYDEQGIYGDGVNVASRIESLSVPGGIFISEKIFDEIKNHRTIISTSIGLFELKNVKRPVEVFTIANKGFPVPDRSAISGKTSGTGHRIAVLPFVNRSADAENEYFSDGITEEIITALTKVEGLMVTSRTSAFVFKGKNEDVRKIGSQLNVSKILEGSVRKAGNRVRVTAQLIMVKQCLSRVLLVFCHELNAVKLMQLILYSIAQLYLSRPSGIRPASIAELHVACSVIVILNSVISKLVCK